MKIFFYASSDGSEEHKKLKQKALDCLLRLDVQVISAENAEFLGRYEKIRRSKLTTLEFGQYKTIDIEKIANILSQCDSVVIENTEEDLISGYIVNLAVSKQISVLLLSRKEKDYDLNLNQKDIKQIIYKAGSLMTTLRNFVTKTRSKDLVEHLHFNVSLKQKQYLRKQSETKKISIARYIRELIDQSMN